MTNRTFAIIKPDAVKNNFSGKIISQILKSEFKILSAKYIKMTKTQANGFYGIHIDKPFFKELTNFMSSGPSWVPRDFYALLLSGVVCGILWELLNFWAGAKWKYTVPWPQGPKLFEMPLLGYLGFPPFALGCASLWRAFDEKWKSGGATARFSAAAGLTVFSLTVMRMIDLFTVKRFASLW